MSFFWTPYLNKEDIYQGAQLPPPTLKFSLKSFTVSIFYFIYGNIFTEINLIFYSDRVVSLYSILWLVAHTLC